MQDADEGKQDGVGVEGQQGPEGGGKWQGAHAQHHLGQEHSDELQDKVVEAA